MLADSAMPSRHSDLRVPFADRVRGGLAMLAEPTSDIWTHLHKSGEIRHRLDQLGVPDVIHRRLRWGSIERDVTLRESLCQVMESLGFDLHWPVFSVAGNIYVWDGYYANHDHIARAIGVHADAELHEQVAAP